MRDILSLLIQETPQSDILRNQRRNAESQALRDASQNAGRLDLLASVAQMANNPGAANATKMAAGSQREQFSPVQLGSQGFMLPSEGQFVESPMFADEKAEGRRSRVLTAAIAAEERRQRNQERIDFEKQRELDRIEQRERESLRRAESAREARALRLTLGGVARANADERARSRADTDAENRVRKFSESLEKAGLPELDQALGNVRGVLEKYRDDIPGYGRLMSLAPDFALTDEAQQVRADMQMAANIILKARSGAAVTNQEQQRFLREVAAGKGFSVAALRRGWDNIFEAVEGKKQNILSSVPDDVLRVYNERSPVPLTRRAPSEARLLRASASSAGVPTKGGDRGARAPAAPSADTPPPGISPQVWAAMPPQDRELFKPK